KAVSLHLEGNLEQALEELNAAIENGEKGAEVYAAQGHVLFELGRFEEAAAAYQQLVELTPNHPTADFNLGICYEKLGQWEEAAQHFEKSLESDPEREDANLGLGICLLRQDKPEPSIMCFDAVLSRQSGQETAQFGKAVSLQL